MISVCRSRDAYEIAGKTLLMLPVLTGDHVGRLLLDEGLIDPEYVSEYDSVLIVFQCHKDLFHPISACRTHIPVVQRGYAEAFVLEEMNKEFNPLSYGNLPGIEQTSGKRIESSSACKAEISLRAVLPFPVLFDRFGMAIWTLFHLKRIDELYLVNRKWLMLCVVPSFAFVMDEGSGSVLSSSENEVLKETLFLFCCFFMAVCMLIGREAKTQTAKS